MDSTKLSQTSMEVLEKLDVEELVGYNIAHVGIVVIMESNDDCQVITRSSTAFYHEKLGMWTWALKANE